MQDAGTALMGIGYGTGDSRAAEAARAAVDSPLLETDITGAKGILFNITGGTDLSMFEVDEAARIITEACDQEANVIFGAVIDDNYTGQVKCTVIATGFNQNGKKNKASIAQRKMNFIHTSIDYLDIPTYQRQSAAETDKGNGNGNGRDLELDLQEETADVNSNNYEMPTFLRRRMEM